jgi:hypothetical protein
VRLIKKAEEGQAANSTNTASSTTSSSSTAHQQGGGAKGSQADKDRPERLKMKLSKRKSEMQNGTPEGTAVLRQPKGPEAQGAKGFGRQRVSENGGGANGDNGTASGSDDNATTTPAAATTTEQQLEADQSA